MEIAASDSFLKRILFPHRQENEERLKFLVDNYADQHLVYTAPEEIEDMRLRAKKFGYLTTLAAFSLNEFARLTWRSRKSRTLLN